METVPADRIETIVGARRSVALHIARAVSDEEQVYILHSAACLKKYASLLDCPFSRSLSRYGIDVERWSDHTDSPVVVRICYTDGSLLPAPTFDYAIERIG